MTKLSFIHDIIERRNFGKEVVKQQMEIVVSYDEKENDFEVEKVNLYENGKYVAEISKLLDKAEGSPLSAMLEAIDWAELYSDSREDKRRVEPEFNMGAFANKLLSSL